MSSVLLYLAIVVMWLCVLIPMWLRKDKTNLAELAELEEYYTGEHQLPDLDNLEPSAGEGDEYDGAPPVDVEKVDVRQFRLRRRAIIVARRRRLLFFTTLLVLASIITAAVQMIPWWGVAPSVVIMLAYMGFLRVAVRVDGDRRARVRQARAERLRRARERRQVVEEPPAEVIELASLHQDVLFDQYAEPPRRAVGD
ncbi:hypothetical protein ETD86_52665 [Nonomuraea turkmeniaca]|uniref:Uncharacterized protein n=1 Tax=Nonomuraea turkmeniaca TaxID=103838 RepID=A0A5S4EV15_9ACTN|nr:hypothetical protein [Nonomuraea turkmeniaca]TMR06514.1 hypothetical protein ETD86_52665 [Nonomuraea turkmeniaca]